MKRHFKKLIPALAVILLAYMLVLRPAISRGTVKLTIRNDTPEPLTVTEVSAQPVNETIDPGGKLQVVYKIESGNTITAYFESPLLEAHPQPCEVEGYVERAYYGNASITVGYDNAAGKATFESQSNITL